MKLSEYIPLERATELIESFLFFNVPWEIRIEARRALIDLEFHFKGINAALLMLIKYLEDEPSLRGQAKLGLHLTRLCQIRSSLGSEDKVKSQRLVVLLRLLEGPVAFCNISLWHHIFCILQVLAGRNSTLHGIPRVETLHIGFSEICSEQGYNFLQLVNQYRPSELSLPVPEPDNVSFGTLPVSEAPKEPGNVSYGSLPVSESPKWPDNYSHGSLPVQEAPKEPDNVSHGSLPVPEAPKELDNVSYGSLPAPEAPKVLGNVSHFSLPLLGAPKEPVNISSSEGRRLPVVKIRVKQPTTYGRADEADDLTTERSNGGRNENDLATTSSVSVDAPERNVVEATSVSLQNLEGVNSSFQHGSQMSAVVGREGEGGKELQ